jgi:predicted metalloprotease with PDZ domain
MLRFEITYEQPQHHFIDFAFYIDKNQEPFIDIHLPSWRPGRYEIGNFAQGLQQFRAYNALREPLSFEKTNKDTWRINTALSKEEGPSSDIIIQYRYYANVLNGGSTFLNEEQLYINPVNSCVYLGGRENEPVRVHLIIPRNYTIATQLPKESDNVLFAETFDELADSPIIASPTLRHLKYQIDFTVFNIWFQGEANIDEKKLLADFISFTRTQINLFEECECKEYDFLMQVLPYSFYHGVEHTDSSVNVIGPGSSLMEPSLYAELIGLCSHELFHSWNVKRIRPACMLPYNFKKENYCSLGYIYEGITTYYGDLILLRCGTYPFEQYSREVEAQLVKHFHNYGRFNQSVADSSMDTWLDGYVPGIPDRKVSIYTEGMLAALILDAHIISLTEGQSNMDDLMRMLYTDFYKENKGYDEAGYQACIEAITAHRFDWYFKEIIHGCGYIEKYLEDALKLLALRYEAIPGDDLPAFYGLKLTEKSGVISVSQVAPVSEAYRAGIAKDDIIHSINGADPSLKPVLNDGILHITVMRNGKIYEYSISERRNYFMNYRFRKDGNATEASKRNFTKWSGMEW